MNNPDFKHGRFSIKFENWKMVDGKLSGDIIIAFTIFFITMSKKIHIGASVSEAGDVAMKDISADFKNLI